MNNNPLSSQHHFISLEEATKLTRSFREKGEQLLDPAQQGKNVLAISESFNRAAIEAILNQDGCSGIRLYSGLKEDGRLHQVLVGINEKDEDMCEGILVEDSRRCPPDCAPPSPLNS